MEQIRRFIEEAAHGLRLDAYARRLGVSRAMFSAMKFCAGLCVNGVPVRSTYILQRGDLLCLTPPSKHVPLPQPASAPLDVRYEDAHLLVINKPAPLACLASRRGGETLQNRVFSHLGQAADFVYRPVNRLDRGTSGLMIVAKSAYMQHRLQRLLHSKDMVREYIACVCNAPPQAQGMIDLPIRQGPGVRREVGPGGKPSRTHYRLLWSGGSYSLLRLRLDTGRTHQIRVHLAAIGCPVWGDYIYGEPAPQLSGRFALHAWRVGFMHPASAQAVECRSPFPRALLAFALQGSGLFFDGTDQHNLDKILLQEGIEQNDRQGGSNDNGGLNGNS